MKRIIIALLATVAAVNISAQELSLGVVGGLNFAWTRAKTLGISISSDSYVGFQAGAKVELDMASYITDGFFLEGSLLYNLKGNNYSGMHTNLGYLQLPINLGYRFPLSGSVSLMGVAGPYVALGVLGKEVEKMDNSKVKTNVFGESYKRFDLGLNYKLGVELWQQWQIYLGFENGLVNMLKQDNDEDLAGKARVLNCYIGTAYMF